MREDDILMAQNRFLYDAGVLCRTPMTLDGYGEPVLQGKYLTFLGDNWRPIHLRVLDALMIKAARHPEKELFCGVGEFAALCGISEREALRQLKSSLIFLDSLRLTQGGDRLFCCRKVRGGITATFYEAYLNATERRSGGMSFPKGLFAVDMRAHPRSYLFGRTIAMHEAMKKSAGRPSVFSLSTLWGEVDAGSVNTSYQTNFLHPFCRDMDHLSPIWDWQWVGDPPSSVRYFSDAMISVNRKLRQK
ncbi:MAG: hypothetical protein IKV45_05895 [Firmicutes bacterium]|nr:hypothetical protein [Bacillota bacterium]